MTLIAPIEWKTELKLRCGVGTLNEVQNIFFNSPSIKKKWKLSTMLCRHFYHVPPWAVISSAPASPSRWGSGELQSFFSKVWGPTPATSIHDALPSSSDSGRLSWPVKSFMRSVMSTRISPSSCLPCKGLFTVHGQGFFVPECEGPQVRPSLCPCLVACWQHMSCAKPAAGTRQWMLETTVGCAANCMGRICLTRDSCISGLSLVC